MTELERYINSHSSPEAELLAELERETNLRITQPQMLSGHIQGRFLKLLVQMLRPQRILEIGTYTGYSALCMAEGLNDGGVVDTIEIEEEIEEFAASFFERSPHGNKIHQHIGSAIDVIPTLQGTYDLIFIDGDKRQYPDYYRLLMGDEGGEPKVHSGSYLLADNILWYGKVVEEVHSGDRHTQGILSFNDMVAHDPRVENVIIPLRDGLNLIRVK